MELIFLCSGNGGNLKFINTYLESLSLGKVIYVLSDRNCLANKFAYDYQIPNKVISFENNETNNSLVSILENYHPDFIITNIHKIISPNVVSKFSGKLINLHYSILPSFKGLVGMNPLHRAMKLNSKFVGSTCHFVNDEVDSGKIISQSSFKVEKNINLEQKMFKAGAITLLNGLLKLTNHQSIGNFKFNEIEFNPSYELNWKLVSEILLKLENDEL